jgi:hypothetical protein
MVVGDVDSAWYEYGSKAVHARTRASRSFMACANARLWIPWVGVSPMCCCGCGMRVVTPLSPAQWRFSYDRRDISLDPSIGNWSFHCRSHYWIQDGQIKWARQWSELEIAAGSQSTSRTLRAFDGDVSWVSAPLRQRIPEPSMP